MSLPESNVPPGFQSGLKVHVSGGGENTEWFSFEKKKGYTNAFIICGAKILLGYKKRGFGKGLFNGFGGKVEPGETPLQAAKRELQEEAGIQAPLVHAGELLFVLEGNPVAFHIDVFRADEYSGYITESDEMRPQWFDIGEAEAATGTEHQPIPYSEMWEDDVYWFPLLFERKSFFGRADFVRNGEQYTIHRWWFGTE
ncbi:NUDIX hydrolase domain-like protein [Amanita rubescens]|nr:NUDIX hydrolase domain-like protein [Amanita rubescens]